jgi:hypothetical protein
MLSHGRNSSKAFETLMNLWELSQARKYLVILRSGCWGGGRWREKIYCVLKASLYSFNKLRTLISV